MNWNEKRSELFDAMCPCIIWDKGTDAQQEFADSLLESFCKRFAKYLCWAIKDDIINDYDAEHIANELYYSINEIDDARWWCNKKNTDDCKVALSLIEDEDLKSTIKKIKKAFDL